MQSPSLLVLVVLLPLVLVLVFLLLLKTLGSRINYVFTVGVEVGAGAGQKNCSGRKPRLRAVPAPATLVLRHKINLKNYYYKCHFKTWCGSQSLSRPKKYRHCLRNTSCCRVKFLYFFYITRSGAVLKTCFSVFQSALCNNKSAICLPSLK